MTALATELRPPSSKLSGRLLLLGAATGTLWGYSIGVSNDAIGPIQQQYSLSGLAVGTVVSSLIAGGLLGCLIAGHAVERHGHRLVLGVAGIVAAAGSIVAATAPNAPVITIGRLILGIAVGVTTAAAPSYIGEIAHVRNRGAMFAGYQFSIAFGFLLALTVGAIFSFGGHEWRIMFAVNVLPAITQTVTMTLIPSSPYYLVARGRAHHARQSLMAIRHPYEIAAELESIIAAHQRATKTALKAAFGNTDSSLRRPLMIALAAAMMDTMVGVGAIVYYSTTVFTMAGIGGRAGAEIASLSIGVINVVSTIAAVGLINTYGRRPLLTVGLSGIIAALVTTGFGLLSSSGMGWVITTIAMLGFMACHAFSAGPIGWLLVGEVLPAHIRSRGTAAALAVNWFATLLVTLLFPVVVGSPGQPQRAALGFFAFAVISFGFLIFIRVCIPETKGLTLAEVEAKLADHKVNAKFHEHAAH